MRTKAAEIFVGETCLPGVLRLPDGDGTAPGIVFTNGYAAYREMYDQMAIALCGAGYATLQYDTRGTSGMGRGRFLCGTQWLEDASAAIGYLSAQAFVDSGRIALAGVSMGGAVTIMQGAADPRVKCLFAMAPVSTGWELIRDPWLCSRGEEAWMAFWERMLRDAERTAQGWPSELVPVEYAVGGRLEPGEEELRERQIHPDKVRMLPLESVLNCCLYVDAASAVCRVQKPIHIVHGMKDPTVPYSCSETLFRRAASRYKKRTLLPEAGHVLPETECGTVTELALNWLGEYL